MARYDAFRTGFPIEWGGCDEAGVVFYPNYLHWLGCTFQCLLRDHAPETKRFRMMYKLSVEDRIVAEGFEVRAWENIGERGRISGRPVDEAIESLIQ